MSYMASKNVQEDMRQAQSFVTGKTPHTVNDSVREVNFNRSKVHGIQVNEYYSNDSVVTDQYLVSLTGKLTKLQKLANDVKDDIIFERRELQLLAGKVNSLEMALEYQTKQNEGKSKQEISKKQMEYEKQFEQFRKDSFEFHNQLRPITTEMKQLKDEVNGAQRKLAVLEIEIGKEKSKQVQERETIQKLRKQVQLDRSIYSQPSISFSHNMENNSTLLKK